MADESPELAPNQPPEAPNPTQKRTHSYPKNRRPARPAEPPAPIAPNPAIVAMETELVPLMSQRAQAGSAVRQAQQAANRANQQLDAAREELAQIEGEVNYRLSVIAQMKGQSFQPIDVRQPQFAAPQPRFNDYPQQPSPYYSPVVPYPPVPTEGIGSFPAPNIGLHPDASPRIDPRNLDPGERVRELSQDELALIRKVSPEYIR
jgi:hypothetical protein